MGLVIDKSKINIKSKNSKKSQNNVKNVKKNDKKQSKIDENKPKNDKKQTPKNQNRSERPINSTYTYRPFEALLKGKR